MCGLTKQRASKHAAPSTLDTRFGFLNSPLLSADEGEEEAPPPALRKPPVPPELLGSVLVQQEFLVARGEPVSFIMHRRRERE